MAISLKSAGIMRMTARVILIIISLFWFVFALLSGSESYGGGISGIIANSPNALPWLLLFVLVFVAWKWEIIGGALIFLMGVASIFFFETYSHLFTFVFISTFLMLLGLMFCGSWVLRRRS